MYDFHIPYKYIYKQYLHILIGKPGTCVVLVIQDLGARSTQTIPIIWSICD